MTDPDQLPALSKVSTVEFVGISDIHPLSNFKNLADSYEDRTFLDTDWASEISERARDTAQQAGYFSAQVSETFKVTLNPTGPADVAVTLDIDKGDLYRLKDIVVTGPRNSARNAFKSSSCSTLAIFSIQHLFETGWRRCGRFMARGDI